jgi:hypothetical protein
MLEYEVHNRDELVAAIKAATQDDPLDALNNPVHIRCGTTHYTFKDGIVEAQAEVVIRRIMETSAEAFEVT